MKKYSLIYIVSMICFLVIAPSCTDMDEDTTGQMVSNDFYADPSLIPASGRCCLCGIAGLSESLGSMGVADCFLG